MFSDKWANRLLRQDWSNPVDLARELYNMFTGEEARSLRTPPTIQNPKQSGLEITRKSDQKAAPASTRSQGPAAARPNRTQIPKVDKPDLVRSEEQQRREITEPADSPFDRPLTPDDQSDFRPAPDSRPTPGAPSEPIAGMAPLQFSRGSGAGDLLGSDYESGIPTFDEGQSYARPIDFGSSGLSDNINLRGITPVSSGGGARNFNVRTDDYEPYRFDGSLTRIPIDEDGDGGSDVFWGKVVIGLGDTYLCNIYTDPDPDTDPEAPGVVSVKIVSIDPKENIQPGTWIYPVVLNAAGTQYYGMVPLWA